MAADSTYHLKLNVKRQTETDGVKETTRTIKSVMGDGFDVDYFSDPDNVNRLCQAMQPMLTDTITAYTIVDEKTYAATIDAEYAAGIDEYNELSNLKLVVEFTDGNKDKKLSLTRPATNMTKAKISHFANTFAEAMSANVDAITADIIGTSDTKIWTAD